MKAYRIKQCGLGYTIEYGLTKEVAIKLFRQGIEETMESFKDVLVSEDKFKQVVVEDFLGTETIKIIKYPYIIEKENENLMCNIVCNDFLEENKDTTMSVKVILEKIDIIEE